MTKPECREIRRELDEVRLGARLSVATMQHLQGCAECEDFHQKQTKLRQLVGRLGMVEAPADFDSQLRRRLANERSGPGYRFPLVLWPVTLRALTVGAAAVVLIFAAFLLVRNVFSPQRPDPTVMQADIPKESSPAPKPTASSEPQRKAAESEPGKVFAVDDRSQRQRGPIRVAGSKQKRSLASQDFSSEAAPVFRSDQSFEATPFTINASQQSFKLSVDDGSGVARTISVPRLTFGSQRVLTTTNVSNQFAPRGVW
jgi:hypothetical protein